MAHRSPVMGAARQGTAGRAGRAVDAVAPAGAVGTLAFGVDERVGRT